MSTASKVLLGFLIPALLGFAVLLSGVAELNANYGRRLEDARAQLAKAETDLLQARFASEEATLDARNASLLATRVIADNLARANAKRSQLVALQEIVTRLNDQLQAMQTARENTDRGLQFRRDELVEYEDKLKDEIALAEEARRVNAERRELLAGLEAQFLKVLAENQSLLEQARDLTGLNATTSLDVNRNVPARR